MTGFGSAEDRVLAGRLRIDIRTVNHLYFTPQLKLPADGGGVDDRSLKRMEAIICSMTPQERRFPDVISGSRKRRIAGGSGTDVTDINRLLKQHKTMEKVMKKLSSKGGMTQLLRGMGQAAKPGYRGGR